MTNRLASVCSVALVALFWLAPPAVGQGTPTTVYNIGYVEIEDDFRYAREFVYARIPAVPRHRPWAGAELGIIDGDSIGQFTGQDFELVRYNGTDANDVANWVIQANAEQGIDFFVLDLDTEAVKVVTEATREKDLILINASDPDDSLRSEFCADHLLHTAPSYNMMMDALTQYLVFQTWTRLLVLQGPMDSDAKLVEALERSVRRNGASIVDKRDFVPSNDPRERELNNIRLMTGGTREYDVVFIADTDGEFGRYVPYQPVEPRPVVGTTGLTSDWWHWTFERHGAPQLNSRFFNHADRFMYGPDWAAWAAVRSVTQAVFRARTMEFAGVREVLLSDQLRMDGYKGVQVDYRPWNRQMRQNILISVHNAVIWRTPMEKFEHAVNDLDTLGVDKPESTCRL